MGHDKSITVPQRDLVRLTDVPGEGQKRHFECSICCYVGTVSEGDAAYRKALERARDAHCPKGETSIQRVNPACGRDVPKARGGAPFWREEKGEGGRIVSD